MALIYNVKNVYVYIILLFCQIYVIIINTKISPTHHVKQTNYEGNPQFIIKIVYSWVVDTKIIITPLFYSDRQ